MGSLENEVEFEKKEKFLLILCFLTFASVGYFLTHYLRF
jgi:hypothetical protein